MTPADIKCTSFRGELFQYPHVRSLVFVMTTMDTDNIKLGGLHINKNIVS